MVKITNQISKELGNFFNINFKVVPFNEWKAGLNIELEHDQYIYSSTLF